MLGEGTARDWIAIVRMLCHHFMLTHLRHETLFNFHFRICFSVSHLESRAYVFSYFNLQKQRLCRVAFLYDLWQMTSLIHMTWLGLNKSFRYFLLYFFFSGNKNVDEQIETARALLASSRVC